MDRNFIEKAPGEWSQVMDEKDAKTFAMGVKRTLLGLLTAALFAVSVIGFIKVATAAGYLAVVLFFGSILALVGSIVLLYAQGLASETSKGDDK